MYNITIFLAPFPLLIFLFKALTLPLVGASVVGQKINRGNTNQRWIVNSQFRLESVSSTNSILQYVVAFYACTLSNQMTFVLG